MKWLVYGSRGWIGGMVVDLLKQNETYDIVCSEIRVDDTKSILDEIHRVAPDRVLCLVGRTHGEGYSTIDYLEQPGKLVENVRDNLYSPVSLAMICRDLNIHMTYLGTGCIFSSDPESIGDSSGYTEADLPDFTGSGYSTIKGFTDRLMHLMNDQILNVRIRMPIVGYDCPRNFITKIKGYSKVVNVQNSMTILPELLPFMIIMAERKETGTINLTNPGTISHNQILDMYKKHIDSDFTWENFSVEEQNEILASKRSNNKLCTTALETLFPHVRDIKTGVEELMKTYTNETLCSFPAMHQ